MHTKLTSLGYVSSQEDDVGNVILENECISQVEMLWDVTCFISIITIRKM